MSVSFKLLVWVILGFVLKVLVYVAIVLSLVLGSLKAKRERRQPLPGNSTRLPAAQCQRGDGLSDSHPDPHQIGHSSA